MAGHAIEDTATLPGLTMFAMSISDTMDPSNEVHLLTARVLPSPSPLPLQSLFVR